MRNILLCFVFVLVLFSPENVGAKESDKSYLKYATLFEVELFNLVHADTVAQRKQQLDQHDLAVNLGLVSRKPDEKYFQGRISVSNTDYFYIAEKGKVKYWPSDGKRTNQGVFDAYKFVMQVTSDPAAFKALPQAKVWWIIPVGILVGQGICAAGEAASSTMCRAACGTCGLQNHSRTCFLGYAEVSCSCYQCPEPPSPLPNPYPYPGTPGFPIIGWSFGDRIYEVTPAWMQP